MQTFPTVEPRRFWVTVALIALTVVTMLVAPASRSAAANASDFNAGYLIDDALFFNGTALNASQIDSFIASKNPGCASGHTCLENYRETIAAKAATTRCTAITAGTRLTPGQIIAKVAVACGISPKAILVILQKEQSLVTASAPSASAFQASMGAGCPDTAPCDSRYAGFYENVYYGASLLKGYTLPSSSLYTRYQAGKTSNILYDTTKGCGTKAVAVKNQATHALYVYTPYTPNKAALDNLYGTGDTCSAYGNRNFWRIYTDWFGSTGAPGAYAISQLYTALGGATGALGAMSGDLAKSTASGGGVTQRYANGLIAWSDTYGAHAVFYPIASTYLGMSGGGGVLGWPAGDRVTWPAGSTSGFQQFQGGLLMQRNGGKVVAVTGAIRAHYSDVGGVSGIGYPTVGQFYDRKTRVLRQDFEDGVILASGAKAAYVPNAFYTYYWNLGFDKSILGWPKGTVQHTDLYGGGDYLEFDNGAMFITPKGVTVFVAGSIYKGYDAAGGLTATGWPTIGQFYDTKTKVLRQNFENGVVLGSATKSGYVPNAFYTYYWNLGFDKSSLGWPKGTVQHSDLNGGGDYLAFDNGAMFVTPTGATPFVAGSIYRGYNGAGGLPATGWPTVGQFYDTKTKVLRQNFENGVVLGSATKTGYVPNAFYTYYWNIGFDKSLLGWPKGTVQHSDLNGGGDYLAFDKGLMFVTPTGATPFVAGSIFKGYNAAGGLTATGWPTVGQSYDKKTGVLRQNFENGVVLGSATKSGYVPNAFYTYYWNLGFDKSTLGWPKGQPVAIAAGSGGLSQAYDGGTLVAQTGGTVYRVPAQALAVVTARGGFGATVGWPVSEATYDATSKLYSQQYSSGTITWSATGAGVFTPTS